MKKHIISILLACTAVLVSFFLITNDGSSEERKVVKPNGRELEAILSSTSWQGTKVYDQDNNDLTDENINFIGLAKYDDATARYEFFDKTTKESRGNYGTFFVTNDGKYRVLISESTGNHAVVEITELTKDLFTYKRIGKDAEGNDVEIYVDHIPYHDSELTFTTPDKTLETFTGEIDADIDGDEILANTLWQGTIALDEDGNDVSEFNSNFLGLAKYDDTTNKYEFFDPNTGESRGDYGYFNVVNGNKIRAHVSLGENKYGAILEITELNEGKFTYKRNGKDKDGNDIIITVEHVPYQGDLTVDFTQ